MDPGYLFTEGLPPSPNIHRCRRSAPDEFGRGGPVFVASDEILLLYIVEEEYLDPCRSFRFRSPFGPLRDTSFTFIKGKLRQKFFFLVLTFFVSLPFFFS